MTNRTRSTPIRSLKDRILELESTMDRNTVSKNRDENLDPLDLDIFHADLQYPGTVRSRSKSNTV